MKFRAPTLFALSLAALFAVGCPKKDDSSSSDKSSESKDKDSKKKGKKGKGDDDDDDKSSDKGSKKKAKKTSAGLADDGNDKAAVKAVKKLMSACKDKWDIKSGFDTSGCDAMKEFRDSKFEHVDDTWLNLIEDDDPKVVWIGVYALDQWGYEYRSDKKMAARAVEDLTLMSDGSISDAQLAYVTCDIGEDAGVWDRMKEIALDKGTTKDIKAMLLAWWHGKDKAYDVVKKYSTAGDKKLLLGAAQGYAIHFDDHGDDACKFWDGHLEDDDKDVRLSTIGHLTGGWSGNTTHDTEGDWYVSGGGGGPSSYDDKNWCSADQIDHALDVMDKRADKNTIDDSNYVYSLANIVKHKKSTAAQKKKAVDVMKKVIETKGAAERSWCLSKLVEVDPSQKAYAAKFASDPELKYTVEEIMKAKK